MQYGNGVTEMSINNIKKPDSLIKAVDRVAEFCPFYNNSADERKKMDMDSAIAELKSAFKEYTDLIEREVIKLTRIYQAEYEEMWQAVIENNDIFNINLDSLMNKNRHLEDKLHGFIAKKADIIFEYSRRDFNSILHCTVLYSRGNTTNIIHCSNQQLEQYLMNYIDKYISIGICQMKAHISNVLHSHDLAIRNKCFKLNMIPVKNIQEKKKIRNALSGKLRYLKRKTDNLKIHNNFENTLAIMVNSIMENEADESYTGIKKRVRRTRKRNGFQ